jgi:hypothetical protein
MQRIFKLLELTCRGICERFRAENKRYGNGIKRCTSCDIFIEYEGTQCPCCRTQLRGKRKSKSKTLSRYMKLQI